VLIVVLSAHTIVIAAIFVPYMALMAGLGTYMWAQVRHHEQSSIDEDERDRDRTDLRLAA
jgi:hypothetical protein